MANKKDKLMLKKEKRLDALLKEGNRYLVVIQQLFNYYKTHSMEYKKLLYVMDRYSRYKTQLKDDIEVMEKVFAEMREEENWEEDEEDEDEFLPIEVERNEEQNEVDGSLEAQLDYMNNIIYRKHIVELMDMIFLQLLQMDEQLSNFQVSTHSKLKIVLSNYCQKVMAVLKRNVNLIKSTDDCKNKQLANRIQNKYKKLQQLLIDVTGERLIANQKFFRIDDNEIRNFAITNLCHKPRFSD